MGADNFSIKTEFRAVDHMSATVNKIMKNVGGFSGPLEKSLKKVDDQIGKISGGIQKIGLAVAAATAVAAAGIVDIVSTGAEFEKTMVAAAAKFDPAIRQGTEGFERLRATAEAVGESTEFNAQQAAAALKDLASAGFTADQAISALPGVVDLATAAEIDLATASNIAGKSLGAFNLQSSDAAVLAKNLTRVNDVLARTADLTASSIDGLFESIKEGGPVATSTGASIETFMAMAGQLSQAGIEGSVAGTTLRNAFLAISAPSKEAANALAKLSVKTKDAQGNARDILDVFGELESATAKMGTADKTATLESIFGKIPLAGVTSLLDKGTESLRDLRTKLESAGGSTARMASIMRDTATGDIDGLSSAIDGVKIALFTMNSGPIRDVIKGMTEWVSANKALITNSIQASVQWLIDNLPTIIVWLERIGKMLIVFYSFAAAVKIATLAVGIFNAVMAANPMTLWIVGILAAVALLWAFWPEISKFFGDLWTGIKNVASNVASAIVDAVTSVWTPVKDFLVGVFRFLVGVLTVLFQPQIQLFKFFFGIVLAAAALVMTAWAPVGGFFSSIWSAVSGAFTVAWDGIVAFASSAYSRVTEAFAPLREFFSGLWDGVASSFTSALSWVMEKIEWLTSKAGWLVDTLQGIGDDTLSGDAGPMDGSNGKASAPEVHSPQERAMAAASSSSISSTSSTSTQRSVVEIKAPAGTKTQQLGGGLSTIRVRPSGAF